MAVSAEKVSTLLAQVDVLGCKALTLRGVIFVERGVGRCCVGVWYVHKVHKSSHS